MDERRLCEHCGEVLSRRDQVRFCSVRCAGLSARAGEVAYTFSPDGKIGYGKLLTGETFLFDGEDFQKINSTMWYRSRQGARGESYVVDCRDQGLHRVILDAPQGKVVDHINLDPLDNRKCNLRLCSHRENQCNRNLQSNNTSGVAGVHWSKRRKTWIARVKYYGSEVHLGAYPSLTEAAQARNEGVERLYGGFGKRNDVPDAPLWIKMAVESKCNSFLSKAI